MRFAYADPPYPGTAHKRYGLAEVDHAALLEALVVGYPDGWALSTNSQSLGLVLPLCPSDVRVLAWVKPSVLPVSGGLCYCWEPVILRGGRPFVPHQIWRRDWVEADRRGDMAFRGAKPDIFCRWLFDCLNAEPGDELDDLYPGSGAVGRAWAKYQAQTRLAV